MWSKYSHSSYDLKYKIEHTNIVLPKKAYDIDFYYKGFNAFTCWLAFSAGSKEIENMIDQMQEYDENKTKPIPYVPTDTGGRPLIDWWPKKMDNIEVFYRQLWWIGYDKENSRVYLYKYSGD